MTRLSLALLGAPMLFAAACTMTEPPTVTAPVVNTGSTTVVAPKPGAPNVVVTTPKPGAPTVVVTDTKVISTDASALAGTYNRSLEACAAAAAQGANPSNQNSYIAVLTPSRINLNGKDCQITGTARDGSAIRYGLRCSTPAGMTNEEAVITRTAQGIQLRNGPNPVETLVNCAAK